MDIHQKMERLCIVKNIQIRFKTKEEWDKREATPQNRILYRACESTEDEFECVRVSELPLIGEKLQVNNWKDDGYTFLCEVAEIVRAYEAGISSESKEIFKVLVSPIKIDDPNCETVYQK